LRGASTFNRGEHLQGWNMANRSGRRWKSEPREISQHPASLDRKDRQSHLQLLYSFEDGLPRRWMFVRFLPELVQDSVCLGDVLDRFCVLPGLFCRTFIGRHICLLC